jgi:hypothetical protein
LNRCRVGHFFGAGIEYDWHPGLAQGEVITGDDYLNLRGPGNSRLCALFWLRRSRTSNEKKGQGKKKSM